MANKGSFAIIVGGGPAPGINGVIGAATTEAINRGHKVYGVMNGFSEIMTGSKSCVRELTLDDVNLISREGGSILCTSRANPKKSKETLDNVVKVLKSFDVKYLITIGGDDTAGSSGAIAAAADGAIKVAHVPKTIDNDLPLPPGEPTFGFQTAREIGSQVVETLQTDSNTTKRWYLVVAMGRTAGHLALGIGATVGATLTIIPEEFKGEGKVPLSKVVDKIVATVLKCKANGKGYGIVVLAEGVLDRVDLETVPDIKVERDPHGHVRYAEISLGKIVKTSVLARLKQFGISNTIVEKDVGYELRCARPTAFDREYTLMLGCGAVDVLLGGGTNVMISRQGEKITPIPFENFTDPATGKAKVRLVDTNSEVYTTARKFMCRFTKADLEDNKLLAKIAEFAKTDVAFVKKELAEAVND